jgi:hypothetical protein
MKEYGQIRKGISKLRSECIKYEKGKREKETETEAETDKHTDRYRN